MLDVVANPNAVKPNLTLSLFRKDAELVKEKEHVDLVEEPEVRASEKAGRTNVVWDNDLHGPLRIV